jgi:perosamine synthetase
VVAQLEDRFASLCGARHAIACNSGTSALHLAYLSLGLGPHDAIITSPLTYIATANAARYCGAQVLFADVREDDWTIDPVLLAERYSAASAIFQQVRTVYVPLYDAANQDGIYTVVDAAHEAPRDLMLSDWQIATWSFYASKVIGCGEGGMVTTNDTSLAARMRLYRGQGATTPGRYDHSVVGYNYRMTDLHAAVALAQLERLPHLLARRRAVIDRYRANLAGSPLTLQGGVRASGWMFACLLPPPLVYDDVAGRMREANVETRPFFTPLHLLPMYGGENAPILSVVEGIWKRGICLPTHADLREEEVDYVCETLLGLIKEAAK